jgi:hypothetical protein
MFLANWQGTIAIPNGCQEISMLSVRQSQTMLDIGVLRGVSLETEEMRKRFGIFALLDGRFRRSTFEIIDLGPIFWASDIGCRRNQGAYLEFIDRRII